MDILVEQLKSLNLLESKEVHKIDEVEQRDRSIPLSIFVADIEKNKGVDITPSEVTLLNGEDAEENKEYSQIDTTKVCVEVHKVLERKTGTSMPLVTLFQDLQ